MSAFLIVTMIVVFGAVALATACLGLHDASIGDYGMASFSAILCVIAATMSLTSYHAWRNTSDAARTVTGMTVTITITAPAG